VAAVCLLPVLSWAWYLPGMAPINFNVDQPVELKVNSLDSVKTQLPYEYYHIPFCPVEGNPVQTAEVYTTAIFAV
jgi:transmembrane 9 superfamily protein 2/4